MTDQDIIDYFKNKELPEVLRLDRASTQHKVKEAVTSNIEIMLSGPNDGRARNRLIGIINALENPFAGPEIPHL